MKKVLCVVLCLLFSIPFSILSVSADNKLENETDARIHSEYYPEDYIGYRYPVLPGTSTWPYGDHRKMVEMCQIPEDIYESMTTEELAQSVLAYPLLSDIYAYDSITMGLERVAENFDGLQEFYTRSDNASCLVDLYSKHDCVSMSELSVNTKQVLTDRCSIATTPEEKVLCKRVLYSMKLSAFLSQDEFIERLSLSDVQTIATTNNELRATNAWHIYDFDKYTVGTTSIMTPKNVTVEVSIKDAIIFITDGNGNNYYSIEDDLPDVCKTAINTDFYELYGIMPVEEPTVEYNCHSYAWYRQSDCMYWMDNSVVPTARRGYTSVSQSDLAANDRVVYKDGNNSIHSAIVQSVSWGAGEYGPPFIMLISKWGMAGLYEHSISNCPYPPDTDSYEYYTP